MVEQHTRYFTEDEVEELVFEGDVVDEEEGYDRRWVRDVTTTVRADDGKLYSLTWDKGLTESQDNMFYDGEYPEVFEHVSFNATRDVDYVTADFLADRPQGIRDELQSLRLVAADDTVDAIDQSFSAERAEDIDAALQLFEDLAVLDQIRNFESVRTVAMDYLHTIRDEAKNEGQEGSP